MKTSTYNLLSLLATSVLILGACSGGAPTTTIDPKPTATSALLKRVATASEFEQALKAGLTTIRTNAPAEAAASASQSNFTTTYTQEKNVDEFDVVKYDGTHMYIAPQRRYSECCFILSSADAPPASDVLAPPVTVQRSIRVMETDPDTGTAIEVSSIPLADNMSVQGMYLDQDRLVTLTTGDFLGEFGDVWLQIVDWTGQVTGFAVYDTSDASAPALLFDAQIDGGFVESRRIGNFVYLITRHTPTIDGLNYDVTTATEQAANEAILASVTLEEMLPHIRINGIESELVDPANCYVTNDGTDPGYPVITTITAIPVDNPGGHHSFCYNEDAYGVYVSENAIYFSQERFDSDNSSSTRLHKFTLAANGSEYRGSTEIEGLLWSGGQNDFRISEHNGYIRVITTQYKDDAADFMDHHLFILEESPNTLALRLVARLPNEDQPAAIGKPNERLYGVRFFADRAYAVTFEQIDPLYVIDLSDPTRPHIAGELQVSGFSDFLHPVSADLLLGLGQSAIGGVKLELFDVSNIANPLSLGSESMGGSGSYSEARFDRHAFTYQSDVAGIDRFIIPAEVYATDGSYQVLESGLYFFEIHNKTTPALASLARVGSLLVQTNPGGQRWFAANRNRSIIHNDTVFYVRDETVWSTFWNAQGLLNGPF